MDLDISGSEIVKAIRCFPCRSAGGPDKVRPQHLKDAPATGGQFGVHIALPPNLVCQQNLDLDIGVLKLLPQATLWEAE